MKRVNAMPAATIIAITIVNAHAGADIVVQTFENDKQGWKSAVGEYTTIDFTDLEANQFVGDHYAEHGVDILGFGAHWNGFLNDGHGIWNWYGIEVEFDEPQQWIAVDHPGSLKVHIGFVDGPTHFGEPLNIGGTGNHLGIVTSEPFDKVIFDMPVGFAEEVLIDDLHYGIPAPGALGLLGLTALLGPGRRRR